jgi:hypothetical protein
MELPQQTIQEFNFELHSQTDFPRRDWELNRTLKGKKTSEWIYASISKSIYSLICVYNLFWICQIFAKYTIDCGKWSNGSYANLIKFWATQKFLNQPYVKYHIVFVSKLRSLAKEIRSTRQNMFSLWILVFSFCQMHSWRIQMVVVLVVSAFWQKNMLFCISQGFPYNLTDS